MVGPFEILPYLGKKCLIEQNGPAGGSKLASPGGRDQTEFRLRVGEDDHRLDPAGSQRGIIEEGTQRWRGPGISVDS